MEKTLEQRRLEVLEDTVKYYSEDTNRRCVSASEDSVSVCMYSPKSVGKEGISQGCAIGRLLPDAMKDAIDFEFDAINIDTLIEEKDYPIPEEIISLGLVFLRALQTLHDMDEYWQQRKGLTPKGEVKVQEIKTIFNL